MGVPPMKLTPENITYIKEQTRVGAMTYKALAEKFGVSIGTIGKAAWKKQNVKPMKPSPPIKANIVRPATMDSEALGQYIADQTVGVLRRLEDLRPFYEELWKRFDKLSKGQKILDCRTRTEYCEKILHRSIRSVQHALYGRRSLKASVQEIVDGLQSEQFIDDDVDRADQEAEEEYAKSQAREQKQEDQRYQKLKSKPGELSEEDLEFIQYYEEERDQKRFNRLTKGSWNKREPKKNLNAEDLKFVQDHQEKLRKKEKEREERRARARAEYDSNNFDFFNPRLSKTPPGEDIKEFASLGRREAARKYHTDRAGGNEERMVRMNQVADWLEKLASEARSEAA